MDGGRLVVGVLVLVGLRGHDAHEVWPLFSRDLEGADDSDAKAEVAHVHLVHLSGTAQFLQQSLLSLGTDPLVHLEPGALLVSGCTILVEDTALASVLEVDRGTLAHGLYVRGYLRGVIFSDDHQQTLQKVDLFG